MPADHHRRFDPAGFYRPAGIDPGSWRVVRCPVDGASHPIGEVSLIEIGNATVVVAEQTGGIGAEELKREALGFFGGRWMTAAIGARFGGGVGEGGGQRLLESIECRLDRTRFVLNDTPNCCGVFGLGRLLCMTEAAG